MTDKSWREQVDALRAKAFDDRYNRRVTHTHSKCAEAVSAYYKIPVCDLLSHSREHRLSKPRHHLCWLLYTSRWELSYPAIGRLLGRDHSTIAHSVRVFAEFYSNHAKSIAGVETLLQQQEKEHDT